LNMSPSFFKIREMLKQAYDGCQTILRSGDPARGQQSG
jgi:hypothetical protein